MNELLQYKGLSGSVEFSREDNVFFGEILGIQGLVLYEGDTIDELVQGFHEMAEEYIDYCQRNNSPLPVQDTTNLPVKLELYRELTETARQKNMSFESCLAESLVRGMNQLKAS
ncbi:MAG: hypothetical protein FWE98_03425 [Oscillospiraceae bacterium]|nr:hypothetical protein [Oscillospiraceae bacterium]